MPIEILFGQIILELLCGIYLSSLFVCALPCIKWLVIKWAVDRRISSCLCSKRKLLNCVDFIVLIVIYVKFTTGRYLSWLSQFWSVVSLRNKKLSHCGHGYQLRPRE